MASVFRIANKKIASILPEKLHLKRLNPFRGDFITGVSCCLLLFQSFD